MRRVLWSWNERRVGSIFQLREGVDMSSEKCEACGGKGKLTGASALFRDHNLCGHCMINWQRLDIILGRVTTWEEFRRPLPKIFKDAGVVLGDLAVLLKRMKLEVL